jgi:hypothetical protein
MAGTAKMVTKKAYYRQEASYFFFRPVNESLDASQMMTEVGDYR